MKHNVSNRRIIGRFKYNNRKLNLLYTFEDKTIRLRINCIYNKTYLGLSFKATTNNLDLSL